MSRSHQLAWAAGFIDGDGFITIQNRKTKHGDKVYHGQYLRVGACQASMKPLEKLQSLFGGSISPKNSGPNREGYNRKPQWIWTISTNEAKEMLEQLEPYLVHKQEVAQLALLFQATMSENKKEIAEEIKQARQQLQADIAYLNSLS